MHEKCDGSCPWAWYTTRGRAICAGFGGRLAARWMKCGLIGFWGRSVAFSFWNVMWWSCGGFATISRKSVWILFPFVFFPPVSTPLLAGPAALRPFCHWAATQDNESLKLRRKLGVISSHSILSNAAIALTPHHPVDPQCTCHAQHLSVIRVCLNSTSYVT